MIKILALSTVLSALTSTAVAALEANGNVNIGDNDGSLVDVPFAATGTPLLSRFGFSFAPNADNHIRQILIWPYFPSPGMMRLDFSDHDADNQYPIPNDDYSYNVTHFEITDARIRQVTRGRDVCRGQCTVPLDKPNGDFVFVLIGFQIQFHGADNHLKWVRLLESDGQLTVTFRDQEIDDPQDTFIWDLQYAYVPRDRFTALGEFSGTGAKDRVLGTIPVGRAVVRGFSFRFPSKDHHIQQISVRPNTTGTVFLTFRDENGDDTFDWVYRWGMLRTLGPTPGEYTIPDVQPPIAEHTHPPDEHPPVEPPKGGTKKQ